MPRKLGGGKKNDPNHQAFKVGLTIHSATATASGNASNTMNVKLIDDDKARRSTDNFTNLALLLRLLCFLNSETRSPTLTGTLSNGPGVAKQDHGANISTLEAVATILVQNHEIIATTHSTLTTVLAASQDSGGGTDLDVVAAQSSTKGKGDMQFAAVPNPDEKTNVQDGGNDDSSRHANPHNLRVLSEGVDLSGAIKEYEWAYVLT